MEQLLSTEYIVSILLSGISLGGQLALIAIGYTMVYGILRLINFAHGDVFMVAGLLGIYISAVTAMGYDAYFVALEAMKKADSADKAALMKILPSVTYTGVSGSIAFDEVGDAVRDTAYIKTANTADGTWVLETVQTGSAS